MADPYEMIVANQFNLPAIDAAATQARRGRLAEMMLGRQMEREQQQEQTRARLTEQYRSGDKAGAKQEAALSGDEELFNALNGLDETDHERVKQRTDLMGRGGRYLLTLPEAERPAAFDNYIDFMVAAGHSDLASYKGKYSPQTVMAAIAASDQAKEYFESRKPLVGRPGDWIMDPNDPSKVLQRVPFEPKTLSVKPDETILEYAPGSADPADLFSRMIHQESRGNQFDAAGGPLTSSAGAIGIAQVMPGTAPEAAQLAGLEFDENRYRTDPEYNMALGQAYFQKQLADFGDPMLAVAAYNAGPARVRQAVQEGGQDWLAHVPAETRDYVAKVMPGTGTKVIAQGPPKQEKPANGTPEGLLSKGYRMKPDGTMEAVAGGPADPGSVELPPTKELAKRNAAYPKVSAAYRGATQKIDKQIADLEKLAGMAGLDRIVGLIDAKTPNITASARAAQALYDQIMARGQFNELQDMRNNSPTGGALGQVSDAENKALRQAAAALDRNQDEPDFRDRLDDYLFALKQSKENLTATFEETYAYRKLKPRTGGGSGGGSGGWGKAKVVP